MGDLTPEELADLRKWVRTAMSRGFSFKQLDEHLKANRGISASDIMSVKPRDVVRSVGQGVTLGHADEITGLAAKMTGGNYTQSRDESRENQRQFAGAHHTADVAMQVGGGVLPAALMAMIPGMQPTAGATLANAGRGAMMAGGMGTVAGAGQSEAPTAGGVAKDAAVSGLISAVLGGAGGAVASKIASRSLPKGSTGAVAREAGTQLPTDPTRLQATLARQEQMAPGTVVLADASPEMRQLARVVGADPKTGMLARDAAEKRYRTLVTARQEVGKNYDVLNGRTAPADPEILLALKESGAGKKVFAGKDVDLAKVHELRGDLLSKARGITKNVNAKRKIEAQADKLTEWLVRQEPIIETLDNDYAFLKAREAAARETVKLITKSSASYATSRTAGVEPSSAGGTVPLTIRGGPGYVIQKMTKVLGPDRGARARAVNDLLLSPKRTTDALKQLIQMHDVLLASGKQPIAGTVGAGLFGDVIPQTVARTTATRP